MRAEAEGLRPEKRRSIFENSAVDAVEQSLVLVLNCLRSNIALGSRPRERTAPDDGDKCVVEVIRSSWISINDESGIRSFSL